MLIASLIILAAVAAVSRRVLGSWTAPAAMLSLIWLVNAVPPLVGAGDREVPALGVAWVAFSCAAFAMGNLAGQAVAPGSRNRRSLISDHINRLLPLPAMEATLVIGTLLGLAFLAIRTVTVGPGWNYGEDEVPSYLKPLYAAQFATPVLGGLALASRKGRWVTLLALACFVPAALTMLLSTRRTIVLLALLHGVGGYLAGRTYLDAGRTALFSPRRLAMAGLAMVGLTACVFIAAACRVQLTGREASVGEMASRVLDGLDAQFVLDQWPRIRHLFFGYMITFAQWIELSWGRFPAPELGAWTFSGPFTLLGIADRPYAAEFQISPGIWTNVYGALHGLILDFSPIGALGVLAIAGLIGGVAHRRMAMGSVLAMPVLVTVYVAVAYSFIASPFRYNVICFSLVYIALYASAMARSPAPRPPRAVDSRPARMHDGHSPHEGVSHEIASPLPS